MRHRNGGRGACEADLRDPRVGSEGCQTGLWTVIPKVAVRIGAAPRSASLKLLRALVAVVYRTGARGVVGAGVVLLIVTSDPAEHPAPLVSLRYSFKPQALAMLLDGKIPMIEVYCGKPSI